MSTTIASPTDLLFDQLRDIFSAAEQVTHTLLDLAANASAPELRELLSRHRGEMATEMSALRRMAESHGKSVGGDHCKAIEGLIEGGNEHILQAEPGEVRDLLIVAHCYRIKHYQIGALAFASSLADCLSLMRDREELDGMASAHRDTLRELAQVAANFFSPCMLESGEG